MCSRVFFQSSKIIKKLREIAEKCRAKGAHLLIDDYHGTNVVPLSLKKENLEDIFLVTGGYKYL
jgi:kynureninase